eukprot:384035-Alexandrium_andersonii.AAC.1
MSDASTQSHYNFFCQREETVAFPERCETHLAFCKPEVAFRRSILPLTVSAYGEASSLHKAMMTLH